MRAIGGRPRRNWLAAVAAAATLASCGSARSSPAPAAAKRLKVVASVFALADAAERIGGGHITLTDLVPPGVAARPLALNAAQVSAIQGADVVLAVGPDFQPILQKTAAGRNTVSVLPLIGGSDPHVWLDPVAMQQVVRIMAQTFQRADPAGTAAYQRGARAYLAELSALDISYRTSLSDCARHDVVTSYQAFGRLARYGLTEHAIAAAPGAAPDPQRLAALDGLIKARHLTTVFDEALTPPDGVTGLAEAARVHVAVLDPIEGVTAEEADRHATYLSLMADNLAKLQSALACSNSES